MNITVALPTHPTQFAHAAH